MRPFPVFSSWPPVRSRFVVERLRSLHRWLAKALNVAGLFLTWVTHSAHAAGIYWTNNPGPGWPADTTFALGRANLDGTEVNQYFLTAIGRKASWSVGRRFTGSTGGCARLPAQTSTARM